jgi:tetratricopeptide (TPR) repeat protein
LSIIYDRIGKVLFAVGKHEEALTAYHQSLAIRQQLADGDKGNAQWQRDLSISYQNVGTALLAMERYDEALAAYQQDLAIAQRFADLDKGNAEERRDLSISYIKIGDVLLASGKLEPALKAYRDSLAISARMAAADRGNAQWQYDLQYIVSQIGAIAYRFVLARDFDTALSAADQAISFLPDEIWPNVNRAHALMFLDRADEARALYLKYRRQQNVADNKSWEAVILEDFAELQKAGLTHPLMQEIEKASSLRCRSLVLALSVASNPSCRGLLIGGKADSDVAVQIRRANCSLFDRTAIAAFAIYDCEPVGLRPVCDHLFGRRVRQPQPFAAATPNRL